MIDGGGHERGMRSGTLNVPGIVGFGKARRARAGRRWPTETARLRALRDRLHDGSAQSLDEIYVNGSMEHRLPGNLNISFAYVEGESLLMGINDVAVSSGSACTSASLEPSYVLKALGVGDELAHSSIRFGLGRFNTEEEVDYVVDKRDRASSSGCARCRRCTRWRRKASICEDAVGRLDRRLALERSGPEESNNGVLETRSSITTRTRATSGRSPRTTRTSAPAWSARRSAAT